MTEPQLDEHATCAAEYCWLTVRNDLGRDTMLKEDLAALLSGPEETEIAFGLFDLDGDSYVTEPEVHSRFQSMYRCACNSCSCALHHLPALPVDRPFYLGCYSFSFCTF